MSVFSSPCHIIPNNLLISHQELVHTIALTNFIQRNLSDNMTTYQRALLYFPGDLKTTLLFISAIYRLFTNDFLLSWSISIHCLSLKVQLPLLNKQSSILTKQFRSLIHTLLFTHILVDVAQGWIYEFIYIGIVVNCDNLISLFTIYIYTSSY